MNLNNSSTLSFAPRTNNVSATVYIVHTSRANLKHICPQFIKKARMHRKKIIVQKHIASWKPLFLWFVSGFCATTSRHCTCCFGMYFCTKFTQQNEQNQYRYIYIVFLHPSLNITPPLSVLYGSQQAPISEDDTFRPHSCDDRVFSPTKLCPAKLTRAYVIVSAHKKPDIRKENTITRSQPK